MGEGGEALAGVGGSSAERTPGEALRFPAGAGNVLLCAGEGLTVGSWEEES